MRRYRAMVTASTVVAVSILVLFVGIVPLIQQVFALNDELTALNARVSILRTKVALLESLDVDTLRAQLTDMLAAVPADKQLPSLFSTADGLAATTGVSINSVGVSATGSIATASGQKRGPEEQKLGSNLLPFEVEVEGSLDQIRSFLGTANMVRRLVRIRDLDITFTGSASATARISMDTFYAALPSAIGRIDEPLAALTPEEETLLSAVSALPHVGDITQPIEEGAGVRTDLFRPTFQ